MGPGQAAGAAESYWSFAERTPGPPRPLPRGCVLRFRRIAADWRFQAFPTDLVAPRGTCSAVRADRDIRTLDWREHAPALRRQIQTPSRQSHARKTFALWAPGTVLRAGTKIMFRLENRRHFRLAAWASKVWTVAFFGHHRRALLIDGTVLRPSVRSSAVVRLSPLRHQHRTSWEEEPMRLQRLTIGCQFLLEIVKGGSMR